MKNTRENIKSNFFNTIILLPILWSFTGMFLYPNGKKAIVALIIIAAITSLFLYDVKNISNNFKYNKLLWLLAASSIFAIVADLYYGYSSGQLRALVSVFICLTLLPPSVAEKINLKFLIIASAITFLTFTLTQIYIYHIPRMWDINPIPYATFIATIAILGFYFLLQSENIKQRTLWLTIFLSSLVTLFYSQSRRLWLALSLPMFTLLLKSLTENKKWGGLGYTHIERKKQLAKQNIISPLIVQYSHYHNQFLDALVKYGVVGLSLLCSICLPVYYFFKKNGKHKWQGLLTVLIFLVAALTDVPFQHAPTLTLYLFIIYLTLCNPGAQLTNSPTEREA